MIQAAARPNSWRGAAAYGLLGAPLAMAALPLFVQLPAYYATHVGLALAPLGSLLFIARLIDMLQDPILGHLLDRAGPRRRHWMLPGALLLATTFAALWLPPASVAAGPWLVLMLILAYGAHSLLNIAYLAWGAQLPMPAALTAITWREGAGLAGMLLASVIPAAILNGAAADITPSLTAYSAAFAALLLLALAVLLRGAPAPATSQPHAGHWRDTLRALSAHRAVRALLLPYFLNALSVAIPATLALFFIADQLHAAHLGGAFLASYFAAAACGLPAWTALARRVGPLACWRLGMLLSVAGFASAALLGPGDTIAYFAVCLAAGAALGADLTLPPVLLAQALSQNTTSARTFEAASGAAGSAAAHTDDAAPRPAHDDALGAGAAFGLFTLLGKLALALAGLGLPLLAWLGYQPGQHGGVPLSLTYAALPCALKLLAMATLTRCTPASQPATSGRPL
ncbi:MFS transporter [Duganella sp. FT80W]|uniref:MFS transporter n=1 Tax=Duganella guangzhouensis TaxID=2666084 RepID=A0A6I2KX88_9BURK|nr:MFS transporter [Duganella guangzhouensis]MRW88599.1 MFS transporter [Duganella guangzhouensis]